VPLNAVQEITSIPRYDKSAEPFQEVCYETFKYSGQVGAVYIELMNEPEISIEKYFWR